MSAQPANESSQPSSTPVTPLTIHTNVGSNPSPVDTTSEDEEVTEVTKKKLISLVWNHFTKEKIDEVIKAKCNYCGKKLSVDAKHGTSHLHSHLKICTKHKFRDIKDIVNQKKLKLEHFGGEKVKVVNFTFDQEVSRKELASMIIMHEYPISIVEHVGFRRYSTSLQPAFKIPSRNTVRNDILKIYDYEKEKTVNLLKANRSRITITTDMWTAKNQKRDFMAITAHFIDDSWILQSRVMRFAYVPCPHTADTLSDVLMETFIDWNIDKKLSTLTVDNCSSNDAIIDILLDKLEKRSLMVRMRFFHMRCCAHILNLIVRDGLEMIGGALEKIRDSVAFWKATPKREEKFEETARQLDISSTKKLVLDCKMRWNCTFLMLQTALIYRDVFSRLKLREPMYKCLPSEDDWCIAMDMCERLKLFYSVTEIFSGTRYPTANLFFEKVCDIRLALLEWSVDHSAMIRSMAEKMLNKFDKYWHIIHGIIGVATVLDPRYKLTLLDCYFSTIYSTEVNNEVDRIRELCYDLLCEYQDRNKRDKKAGGESSHSFSSSMSEAWWRSNGIKYPTLMAMARDILAIPISTVASESAFSTSGRFLSPHRNRLHPNVLEALMCTRDWLWAKFYQEDSSTATSYYQASLDNADDEGGIIDIDEE